VVNPFAEIANGDFADAELVEQAKNGDRAALEKLILRHQAWIYNIAVRMVFQPQDAEDGWALSFQGAYRLGPKDREEHLREAIKPH
jgi:DNA-directed RNA polymerase specialized sigma24 family protein